jgi:hypothetical protein
MNLIPFSPVPAKEWTAVLGRAEEDLESAGTPSCIPYPVSFGQRLRERVYGTKQPLWFPGIQRQYASKKYGGRLPYISRMIYRETHITEFTQLKDEGST